MRDYSQHGEQAAILEWAAGRQGSFIDLGCYDGAGYSNTAALADLGWSGICVDAAPDAAGACAKRYADRDDVTVILAAFSVTEGPGPVTVHWSPNAMYTGLSASRRPEVELVSLQVQPLDLVWFADHVQRLPRPLFCSVDLEGASLDAVNWLLAQADPDCLCVEANTPPDRDTLRAWLKDWREVPLHRNYVNLLFVREPALVAA